MHGLIFAFAEISTKDYYHPKCTSKAIGKDLLLMATKSNSSIEQCIDSTEGYTNSTKEPVTYFRLQSTIMVATLITYIGFGFRLATIIVWPTFEQL